MPGPYLAEPGEQGQPDCLCCSKQAGLCPPEIAQPAAARENSLGLALALTQETPPVPVLLGQGGWGVSSAMLGPKHPKKELEKQLGLLVKTKTLPKT